MKTLILIIALIAFSCSEEEFTPCYQAAIEARKAAEAARGTDQYDSLKQVYIQVKSNSCK